MAKKSNLKYYMSVDPFRLTDVHTLESKEFKTYDLLLKAALRKTCTIYVYNLNQMSELIATKLINDGYEAVSTASLPRIDSAIEKQQFVVLGSKTDAITHSIRIKRTTHEQVEFYNLSGLYGGASLEDICIDAIGEFDEVYGACAAIIHLEDLKHNKKTLASNALNDVMNRCFGKLNNKTGEIDYGIRNFQKDICPPLEDEIHNYIMTAFQGGLVYYNDLYKGTNIIKGKQFDVNSLYPHVMMEYALPVGIPEYFEGKYKGKTSKFSKRTQEGLYVQRVLIDEIKLKDGAIPYLKDQDNSLRKIKEEIIEEDVVELTLTNIDLARIDKHYTYKSISYIDGYSFNSRTGMFNKGLEYWYQQKEEATIGKNGLKRRYAKLMMNSVFGKFASRTDKKASVYVKKPNGKIKLEYLKDENDNQVYEGSSFYSPIGVFIASHARNILLDAIEANKENFIYCDTDSMYLKGEEVKGIEVHPTKLGAWKEEFTFDKMCISAKKQYAAHIVEENGQKVDKVKAVLSGIPDTVKEKFIKSVEDFESEDLILEVPIHKYNVLGVLEISKIIKITLGNAKLRASLEN